MKTHCHLISFLFLLLLHGCSDGKKDYSSSSEEFLSFDVNTMDNKVHELKLTDLMESVEIIPMDSDTLEAFIKKYKIAVSKNFFAIHHVHYPVKLYSRKSGKFLGNIGKVGEGPGEYFLIWNVEIDEKHNRIYLVNSFRNYIYAYDLNGNFHEDETIRLPEGELLERAKVYFDKDKNQVAIFQTPYSVYQRGKTYIPDIKYLCRVQDFSGKLSQSISSSGFLVPRNDSDVWVLRMEEESPIYSLGINPYYDCRKDTIYHYNIETNQIYPVYTSNMHAEKLVTVCSKETPLHFYTCQQTYREGTDINPENRTGYKLFQVDKKTGKGRYIQVVNDYLGGIKFDVDYWFWFIRDDYVAYYWEPLALKEELEEALSTNREMSAEVRERILKLKDLLHENSNDILMICKFKKQ